MPTWGSAPLVLRRESWGSYEKRVHQAIGLDVRQITGTLTKADRKLLKKRKTQPLPLVDMHEQLTEVATGTTLPMMEV